LDEGQTVRVAHPFHPLFGQTFTLLSCSFNWGQHRVDLQDEQGNQSTLPASWTDVVPPDPFVVIAAGRSAFRVVDLVALAALVDCLQRDAQDTGGESGKEIMPDV
jgi:hypothetical protein